MKSPRSNHNNNSKTPTTTNYASDTRLSGVYSSSVPKPKGFSYAHVWSGKPRTHQHQQQQNTNTNTIGTSLPDATNVDHPQKRKKLMQERKEEMTAIRDELAPQMEEIIDPSLSARLNNLLEEQPRTKKAAILQKRIISLLRVDAKLREGILSFKEEDEIDDRDLGSDDDDNDEESDNDNNNRGDDRSSASRRSRSSSSFTSSSSSISSYSSSSSRNSSSARSDETPSQRRARHEERRRLERKQRKREQRAREQEEAARPLEVRQQEKMQQLLREGKRVIKTDLRPRKPDAKKGSRIIFNPDINKGMRLNHGAPKLHPYRVMSLPWNKARAVAPQKLVDGDDHEYVVVDDTSHETQEVKDLRFKQARSQRLRVENSERLERREILAQAMRGFEEMRYFAKRQKTEIILRHNLDEGHVPSASKTVSIRQKMYQTLLGEKRPFPPKAKKPEEPDTVLRLCFVNSVHMSDDYVDDFISIEGLTKDVEVIDQNNNNNKRKSAQQQPSRLRQTGMLVDPTILSTELRPCLVAGRIIQSNIKNQENPSSSPSSSSPNHNNNDEKDGIDEKEKQQQQQGGLIELTAVTMDDATTTVTNDDENDTSTAASATTTGRVLGRAVLPTSIFNNPKEDEVPLLQVDVPIYTLDQKQEVANCEMICESIKLFNKNGVGYLKGLVIPDENQNNKNNKNDSINNNNHNNSSSTASSSPVSAASSSPSAVSRSSSTFKENEDNNNNSKNQKQKTSMPTRFRGPSHCLVECALIDTTPKDAPPECRYAPVAAVRSTRQQDRALQLKPANCTPHPSCAMLVPIPRCGTGNGTLNILRFDVGLFPPENDAGGGGIRPHSAGSSSLRSGRLSSSRQRSNKNNNSNDDVASEKEPELIPIDFDLMSIVIPQEEQKQQKQEEEHEEQGSHKKSFELASAVDVPITENISIRLQFTFLGREVDIQVPQGEVSPSMMMGNNNDTTTATSQGGYSSTGSVTGNRHHHNNNNDNSGDILSDDHNNNNTSGGVVMGLTQEEQELYYGEHRSLSETMEEDKERKTAVSHYLHQQQKAAPHPASVEAKQQQQQKQEQQRQDNVPEEF